MLKPVWLLPFLVSVPPMAGAPEAWAQDSNAIGHCVDAKFVPDKQPEAFCGIWSVTSGLKADPDAQKMIGFCKNFYQSTFDTLGIICSYDAAAAKLKGAEVARATGVKAQAGNGNGSFNSGATTGVNANNNYLDYQSRIHKALGPLHKAETDYINSAKLIVGQGKAILKTELHCSMDGTPGRAEGAQLMGASQIALAAAGEITAATNVILSYFLSILQNGATSANQLTDVLKAREGKIAQAGAQTESGAQPPLGHEDPHLNLTDPLKTIAKDEAGQALARAIMQEEAQIFSKGAAGSAGRAVSSLLNREALGGVFGGIFKITTAEHIDGMTLSNVGLGLVAAATLASTWQVIAIGIVADVLELGIRYYERALEKTYIIDPFVRFIQGKANLDSGQAAAAYASIKRNPQEYLRPVYCQKCMPSRAGCPMQAHPPFSEYNEYGTVKEHKPTR